MKKELHPLCELFPEMSEEEFNLLCNSVKQNGLRNPIILHKDGRILDGRGRQAACEKMGVEPKYTAFRGDDEAAAKFVIDENIARRHLKSGQLAAFAAKALGWYEEEAAKRKAEGQRKGAAEGGKAGGKGRPKGDSLAPKSGGKANNKSGEAVARAAKDFGTSRAYVAQAKKIKDADPALFRKVERGAIKIPQAMKIIKKREEEEEKRRHREEDPNWIDWDEEVKGYRKLVKKFSKKVKAFENSCVEICTNFVDVREHIDPKEVEGILKGCFSDALGTMSRGIALFEQFKE